MAEDLPEKLRRAKPRPFTPAQKVMLGALIFVAALIGVALASGNLHLVSFVLSVGVLSFSEVFLATWTYLLVCAGGFVLAKFVHAPTVEVVYCRAAGEPARIHRVWYKAGSHEIDGDNATWLDWRGRTHVVNRRFLVNSGIGGYRIVQEVEAKITAKRVVYETTELEATRSMAMSRRVREAESAATQKLLGGSS